MSKADKYVAYLEAAAPPTNKDAARDYIWGAEGDDPNRDGDPEWDCSGLRHAALVAAGISDRRTTADGYMRRAHAISAPSEIGDFRCHVVNGHATHIIEYVGRRKTIEAQGRKTGVVRDTVEHGHGPWFREDRINKALGQLSAKPAPKPVIRAVTATALNLRSGAGTKYRVVKVLKHGVHVVVLRKLGAWSRVRVNGVLGWVATRYLGKV